MYASMCGIVFINFLIEFFDLNLKNTSVKPVTDTRNPTEFLKTGRQ